MFVFLTYLPVFLLKFRSGELVGPCIQRVPTRHTFDGPRYPKNNKYLKKWNDDVIIPFFQEFLVFWGSRVHKKYAVWVLFWCEIKLCIQRSLPLRIWVKTQGDILKIRIKKVVFFILPPKLITIILLFFLGGPFYTSNFL